MNLQQILYEGELLTRIFLACIMGGAIGYERKNRNKCAGIRTHAIVALGAALIMVVSKYGFSDINNYDAARVAAQVVSGVGFIGAGIIFIRNNNSVSGLTTAAGIWSTAGVGLAMGSGLHVIGTASAIMIVIMQIVMHKVSFLSKENFGGDLRMTLSSGENKIDEIKKLLEDEGIETNTIKINKSKKDELKIELSVIYPAGYNKIQLITRLSKRSDILGIYG